jgi:hypothetical protein
MNNSNTPPIINSYDQYPPNITHHKSYIIKELFKINESPMNLISQLYSKFIHITTFDKQSDSSLTNLNSNDILTEFQLNDNACTFGST